MHPGGGEFVEYSVEPELTWGGKKSGEEMVLLWGRKKRRRARSSRLLVPLSGMSGQPDGGRLTGRVLAYLLIPAAQKKFR
jgi:hypothetical protein